jgi:hypothetical protein
MRPLAKEVCDLLTAVGRREVRRARGVTEGFPSPVSKMSPYQDP